MIGQTVSHCRVVEKLDGEGMGIDHTAEDTQVHHDVALKFLPETHIDEPCAREPLEREAHSTSVPIHPRVCTGSEIGEHDWRPFIGMGWEATSPRRHLGSILRRDPQQDADLALPVEPGAAERARKDHQQVRGRSTRGRDVDLLRAGRSVFR